MMWSDEEKQGATELLQLVEADDLLSLAKTVTNRLLFIETKEEAVRCILLHERSAEELLRRKKLKRDILFEYLSRKSVQVDGNVDKDTLVLNVISLWQQQSSPPSSANSLSSISTSSIFPSTPPSSPAVPQPSTPPSSPAQIGIEALQRPQAFVRPQGMDESSSGIQPTAVYSSNFDLQLFSNQFVSWFYKMWNVQNPKNVNTDSDGSLFGPEHFWRNCSLCTSLKFVGGSDIRTEHRGAMEAAEALLQLIRDHNLFFNPNQDGGVRGKSEAHGLVIVLACGTIHQGDQCVGIFEQIFGVLRDPGNENNWKIQYSDLRLTSGNVSASPVIESTDLAAIAYS